MTEETMDERLFFYGFIGIVTIYLSVPSILLFMNHNIKDIIIQIIVTIVGAVLLLIVSIIIGWVLVHGRRVIYEVWKMVINK